ncbi:MAG: ATP-dependent helicase [Bacteroidia bacterium]
MEFEKVYDQLNTEQKKAVDLTEGVVMVVAGPGTGKTQVLGARIAKLLIDKKQSPEQVLCLTFTDAATIALRERLFQFIGSNAHRVNIFTYHAFCNQIIQDNKDLFGKNDLEPISDLEVIELVREIIDELEDDHLLKRLKGDVYYDANGLIKLFGLLKKENLDANKTSEMADQYIEQAKTLDKFIYQKNSKYGNKGDLKKTYFKEVERIGKLKAAASLLPMYNSKLKKKGRYDYNDMIHWVLDAFKEIPDLLAIYQEKYEYVLVDEYQDTNGAQNQLLLQLIAHMEVPNAFVVGDDDQSIYKFQGANVENIYSFYKHYETSAKLVVLDQNYRSNQEILEASGQLITRNEERLINKVSSLTKTLKAVNPDRQSDENALSIDSYQNSYQEIVGVAEQIKKLQKQEVDLDEIAILYRNHKQSELLIQYFEAESIPFQVVRSQDVLQVELIKQLILLLKYLSLENKRLDLGQSLLFEIFHFASFSHIKPIEIYLLSKHLYQNRDKGWREGINDLDVGEIPALSDLAYDEIKAFNSQIEEWLKDLHNIGLQSWIEKIINEAKFLKRAFAEGNRLFNVHCLNSFFNFIKSESSRNSDLNLNHLLQTIDLLKANNLGIHLKKISYGKKGVQLMTAHGSKGLEFDYVFIISILESKWEKGQMSLPFYLNSILEGEPDRAHEEEGRRLFYVAMTRARKKLFLSRAGQDSNGKYLNKSMYLAEIEESYPELTNERIIEDSNLLEFFKSTNQLIPTKFEDLTQHAFVDSALRNFKLSPTNLNTYLRCPVAFFYEQLLKLPRAKTPSLVIGSAVHRALEVFFKQTDSKNGWVFPSAQIAVEAYNQHLLKNKEVFTPSDLERSTSYGKQSIPAYIDYWLPIWSRYDHVLTELTIDQVEVEGVPIHGQIDKLILTEDHALVVDYKTGKYQYAVSKLKPPEKNLKDEETNYQKIYGGDYWRQLVFYKILIQQSNDYSQNVQFGVIDFIEKHEDAYKSEHIPIDSDAVSAVRSQIIDGYRRIKNKEFSKACNDENCDWCKFNNTYLVE